MSRRPDTRVLNVIAQLIDVGDWVSVATLAYQQGVTERQLERLFKRETGVSIRSFAKCHRLHRAAALLLRDDLATAVKIVQLEAHYSDPATFAHEFRAHFGYPPSKFRSLAMEKRPGVPQYCSLKGFCPWFLVTGLDPNVLDDSEITYQLLHVPRTSHL